MDDLKLLGRNENELKNEMKIVQTVSKDISKKFGLEKCARMCLKEVVSKAKCKLEAHLRTTLKNWNREKHISNEKEKLKKDYLRSLRLVFGTELSAKNAIHATGSLAVPVH